VSSHESTIPFFVYVLMVPRRRERKGAHTEEKLGLDINVL